MFARRGDRESSGFEPSIVNPDWRKEAVSGHAWTTAGGHICGAVRAILGDLDELALLSTSFA
jgi:hypothetical protein